MGTTKKRRLSVIRMNVKALTLSQIDGMWSLYAKNYLNADRTQFEKDLEEKTSVFYAIDRDHKNLVGFTTAKFYLTFINGKKVGIFYSGDTMLKKEYWGRKNLHWAVAKEALFWKLRHPFTPLYWFLVVMGYRTYLAMARNFKNYWPAYDRPTPKAIESLLHHICQERFGGAYKRELGLIEPQNLVSLKNSVAPITDDILSACPEVRFLVEKNPQYSQGVEMPCLGHLDMGFVQMFGRKMLRSFEGTLVKKASQIAEPAGSFAK